MNGASLLEQVQGLLERTYRMRTEVREIGRFVIGDAGFERLYRDVPLVRAPSGGSVAARGAQTLVRETSEGIRACVYLPDALVECLESIPPQRCLDERNVDAFASFVEEVDHLLCIAERAREDRAVTLFELELHANVSKHLVLARFLSGVERRPLDARRRVWLRYHLFHKGSPADEDSAVRARYRDAARWALRLLEAASGLEPSRRIDALRRFHIATVPGKFRLIRELAR